ncbi:MAG: insulinase family protein [Tannerellaceae bacterium]|nr:insulinase family protein [Tannerellaceae bacterium]
MKKYFLIPALLVILLTAACTGSGYPYETVPNDPLGVRIYTLDNGLKVYLSVNKEKPRIQTFIGVRVGGKNDPAETTGLAHYFEHLMFKGTQNFGTTDYEAEKPLLDRIEQLYETYRITTDEAGRKAIYAEIDSVSQEASKIAIPNEYDKLMSAIGSQWTNAFTSYDVTAYMENIPANEIDTWTMIQAERFTNPVLRLFHTELETVYEEYNMSLTRDGRKVYEAVLNGLFPHHPYGTQTVLGTAEHLKNPSIINIKNYFDTYYVPNNMAVVMVGDFNPDEVIKTIDKYFGSMESKDIPQLVTQPEQPITEPIIKEVIGLEAENIAIAFRLPGANTKEAMIMEFVDYLLTNGKAGLIDLNLVQKQKVLGAGSYTMSMADYTVFQMYGTPKAGQTLDEVKDLLLGQLEDLKKGEFEEWLLEAVINNFKLEQYYQQQESMYAAYLLLNSFVNETNWKDEVNKLTYLSGISKQDIIDFCNKYLNNNYLVVYKREGKPDENKIDKPEITPISTNRDEESSFLAEVKSREIKPIEPVFVNYEKDMAKIKIRDGIELLYTQNKTNPLFSLHYVYEMGNNNDRALGLAFQYLNYLGTSQYSAEEIKSQLYQLACSFGVHSSDDRVYVSVNGLNDNFEKAMNLLEDRLADAMVDIEAYHNLAEDILKRRGDDKLDQYQNYSRLVNYATWGPQSPVTNIIPASELKNLNPDLLIDRIKSLKNYEHRILYYGPLSEKKITDILKSNHKVADQLQPAPAPVNFVQQETPNQVLLAHYDANQIYMSMIHKGETGFHKSKEVERIMYNNYFSGGMNSIVFQEMREARGLAYSAWAQYNRPGKPDRAYYLTTFIATQNDKMKDAIGAFHEILDDMPESEQAFAIAKESLITDIRTARVLGAEILWNYMNAEEFGYTEDPRKEQFEKIPGMTLNEAKAFQQEYVKGKSKTYAILGDTKDLDQEYLRTLGPVKILTQEQIFGY